jgi:hypothetical protein
MILLLYNCGLYLIFIGVYSLLNDSDIYIGFLWVIDLGVGLVFFIFMLHFIPFLHQKSKLNFFNKNLIIYNLIFVLSALYFYFFSMRIDSASNLDLDKS